MGMIISAMCLFSVIVLVWFLLPSGERATDTQDYATIVPAPVSQKTHKA